VFNQQEKAPSAPSHPQQGWHSITAQISTPTAWAAQPRVYDEPFHYPIWSADKGLNYLCHVGSLKKRKTKDGDAVLSITMFTQFSPIITEENHHVPFPRADRLAMAAQRRQLEVPPASLPAQKLHVGRQTSVWSAAEKSPGKTRFYRIELKHLTLLYSVIIIVLLSEFQRGSVE